MRRRILSPPLILIAVAAALAAATGPPEREIRWLAPGVRLISWSSAQGPNELRAVEVETAEPLIGVRVTRGAGEQLGLEPLARQAERLTAPGRVPVAAVNGDFFYFPSKSQPGIPTNALVTEDELIRTPFPRSSLVLPSFGPPAI